MTAFSRLAEIRNQESLKLLMQELARICGHLDLQSFLLEPMQRVTRYPMMLRQILKYTPETNPEHAPLKRALAESEENLRNINEAVRDKENIEKALKLDMIVEYDDLAHVRTLDTRVNVS